MLRRNLRSQRVKPSCILSFAIRKTLLRCRSTFAGFDNSSFLEIGAGSMAPFPFPGGDFTANALVHAEALQLRDNIVPPVTAASADLQVSDSTAALPFVERAARDSQAVR